MRAADGERSERYAACRGATGFAPQNPKEAIADSEESAIASLSVVLIRSFRIKTTDRAAAATRPLLSPKISDIDYRIFRFFHCLQ